MYRAIGTVLGAIAGFLLVSLLSENNTLLLVVEVIAAFLFLYRKRFHLRVFVFILSIFIVVQIASRAWT